MGSSKMSRRQKVGQAVTKRLSGLAKRRPDVSRGAAVTTVVTAAVVGVVGYVLGRRVL